MFISRTGLVLSPIGNSFGDFFVLALLKSRYLGCGLKMVMIDITESYDFNFQNQLP